MKATRRGFLEGSLTTFAGLVLGGADGLSAQTNQSTPGTGTAAKGGVGSSGAAGAPRCPDPFAGGELLGTVAFVSDDRRLPKNTLIGPGWDARLCTDLEKLDSATMIVPNEHFFVRTRYPDQLDPNAPWSIEVSGRVGSDRSITMNDLTPLVKDQRIHVMECAGNVRAGGFGLLSAAEWSGVAMRDVLELIDVSPNAASVLIGGFDEHSAPSLGGHSTPGASWVFPIAQLLDSGAFLATKMNGVELSDHHGKPVRLVVPGWYACACIKWVNQIELVGADAPATAQMKEFASRTHQDGAPDLAADYKPPSIDQAAMPIRIEKWRLDGKLTYRVSGVLWGGYEPTAALSIRFGKGQPAPVEVCPMPDNNRRWWLWSYTWKPPGPGPYAITLVVSDPKIVTKRLDNGYYLRQVYIDEV
jgi:DMSO/TMAO reductase YedYZ molybdopterin-dependent catalytic subunit